MPRGRTITSAICEDSLARDGCQAKFGLIARDQYCSFTNHSEKISVRKIQNGRRCIFCGGQRLSREHFWPEWSHSLLGQDAVASHIRTNYVSSKHSPHIGGVAKERRDQGSLIKHKIKMVCEKCNNGWMSARENDIKNFLTPMIMGELVVMDERAQAKLAAWIAMKIMVAESENEPDAVSTSEDRLQVMVDSRPPDGWLIHVGQHSSSDWKICLARTAITMVFSQNNGKEFVGAEHFKKNTQLVTFGFGRLVVQVFSTKILGFRPEYDGSYEKYFRQVYPYKGDFGWPTGADMATPHIAWAADALNRLTKRPGFAWFSNSAEVHGGKKPI